MHDLLAPDQVERNRITTELDDTVFVDAGAGSGKTRMLVERVERLVVDTGVPLSRLAVITFTEKAAAELRDRIRTTFAALAADPDLDPDARARARAAHDDVDGAAISTLHGFAQRLLTEHPVEAGLPPRLEVLDEVASEIEMTARWNRFRQELLDDPANERALLLAEACGIRTDDLRLLAVCFAENWDLVADRVVPEVLEPPRLLVDSFASSLESLAEVAADCTDPDDKMLEVLARVGALAAALRGAVDEYEQLEILAGGERAFSGRNKGRKANWPPGVIEGIREELGTLKERSRSLVEEAGRAAVAFLAAAVGRFTLDAAAARRAAGRLEFHDLLVLARALLADPVQGPAVRAAARRRYQRLLLDEFQDTDPIQLELAVLLSADPAGDDSPAPLRWDEMAVDPGRLFVVGDPKQSIYRFRRADVTLYLRARAMLAERDGRRPVVLSANFRTVGPVIDWVNHVFAQLIRVGDDPLVADRQPEYQPLTAVRDATPVGAAVTVLGSDPHPQGTSAAEVRAAEATDVADVLARAHRERWTVGERGAASAATRPLRWGDCAVLLPARTSLGALTDALDRAGVPWRAETSSLVYATREIRDVLSALRAVADPSDELSTVAALRSVLFGCGDDDLAEYRVRHGGSFRIGSEPPAGLAADHPVVDAMAHLSELAAVRPWSSPSELIDRLVADRRLLEVAATGDRARDLWRRVRFVVDQARAWSDAGGGSLRAWVAWATRQGDERSRVTETVLPETDDDSVRILTVHGAKGLEFPLTVVSGLSTRPQVRRPRVQVVFPPDGGVGYRVGSQVRTQTFSEQEPIEEQLDHHERVRLLYVACTRARDHLVVSTHRAARNGDADHHKLTNAELLALAGEGAPADRPGAASAPTAAPVRDAAGGDGVEDPTPDGLARFRAELAAHLGAAARRSAVAATTLAAEEPPPDADPGLAKSARDLDLPPWLKGRYGSAVGRATHGVLQTVDLASGDGLDELAAAQAAAEGLFGHEAHVAALARSALAAPIVAAAASSPRWRELYLAAPVDGVLLEGYLDLLVRTPEGLVVVDYKTGARSADDAAARVERYRTQGAAYALLVDAALGEVPHRVVFLFLHPDGAFEVDLDDLPGAVAEVRGRVGTPPVAATAPPST